MLLGHNGELKVTTEWTREWTLKVSGHSSIVSMIMKLALPCNTHVSSSWADKKKLPTNLTSTITGHLCFCCIWPIDAKYPTGQVPGSIMPPSLIPSGCLSSSGPNRLQYYSLNILNRSKLFSWESFALHLRRFVHCLLIRVIKCLVISRMSNWPFQWQEDKLNDQFSPIQSARNAVNSKLYC